MRARSAQNFFRGFTARTSGEQPLLASGVLGHIVLLHQGRDANRRASSMGVRGTIRRCRSPARTSSAAAGRFGAAWWKSAGPILPRGPAGRGLWSRCEPSQKRGICRRPGAGGDRGQSAAPTNVVAGASPGSGHSQGMWAGEATRTRVSPLRMARPLRSVPPRCTTVQPGSQPQEDEPLIRLDGPT